MERLHHRLRVWKEAMGLVSQVYQATRGFPEDERFGLSSQMRRAAVSIPSNIAEGAARGSKREFLRFLCIARGSLSELETQARIAIDLGFLPTDSTLPATIDSVFGALGTLIKQKSPE